MITIASIVAGEAQTAAGNTENEIGVTITIEVGGSEYTRTRQRMVKRTDVAGQPLPSLVADFGPTVSYVAPDAQLDVDAFTVPARDCGNEVKQSVVVVARSAEALLYLAFGELGSRVVSPGPRFS